MIVECLIRMRVGWLLRLGTLVIITIIRKYDGAIGIRTRTVIGMGMGTGMGIEVRGEERVVVAIMRGIGREIEIEEDGDIRFFF